MPAPAWLKVLKGGDEEVFGHFFPNGTTTPSNTTGEGIGWTVARTDVGILEVTFTKRYKNLVYAHANMGLASGSDVTAQIGVWTPATETTPAKFVIRTRSAGANADVASNANNRIFFRAIFRVSPSRPFRGR